ncbi:MAG: carboxypeptidase regulatory-like domain-containing protein, partial [bacterium]|nr:carboxypeptidase regulatory-like domain-containing protein [bacterium]
MRGRVFWLEEDGSRSLVSRVAVRVEETRKTTLTDDTGFFRFVFPASYQAGGLVTLAVEKEGWVIRRPLDGEVRLPVRPTRDRIDIELVPKGSKVLWAHERLEKLIADHARASVTVKPEEREVEFTRALRRWAERYGFGLDEVRREIARWSDEVLEVSEDAHERGLAEFASQRFLKAEQEFDLAVQAWRDDLAAVEAEEHRLAERKAELRRRLLRDLEL